MGCMHMLGATSKIKKRLGKWKITVLQFEFYERYLMQWAYIQFLKHNEGDHEFIAWDFGVKLWSMFGMLDGACPPLLFV